MSRDLAAESEAARAAEQVLSTRALPVVNVVEQKLQEEKAAREREKAANQLEIRTLSAVCVLVCSRIAYSCCRNSKS